MGTGSQAAALAQGRVLQGTPVVPGVVHAPAHVVRTERELSGRHAAVPLGVDDALAAYDEAAGAVADGYLRRAEQVSDAAAQVLTATAGMARDRGLRDVVVRQLRSGDGLLGAVHAAVDQFAAVFAGMGGLMATRVTDLRDIERRVVARLLGEPDPRVVMPEQPCVLVADDLPPSEAVMLDPALVLAVATELGGPTSHTAIIARQLAIPYVAAVRGLGAAVADGVDVLLDGGAGTLEVEPEPERAARRARADRVERGRLADWSGRGATADGLPVALLANVADAASARAAAHDPVEGVGLFRTELSFLDRPDEPSVEEQAGIYADVLSAFVDRYVIVRTLDAGSEKVVGFASHGVEENPALGVRGVRFAADDAGLLDRQLDAIALAASRTGTETWVMAPMVATVAEATDFAAKVHGRGLRAGVMVEVPSAALLAHRMLEVVDFLSIGTNDLTQYTMAADRMAADLAHLTDPWQPAVLQLIAITADSARRAGKPVGVCGEAAADPLLACVLVGLGATSLSMAAAAVRPVGARLAGVPFDLCEEAAEAAVAAADPAEGREAVRALLGG